MAGGSLKAEQAAPCLCHDVRMMMMMIQGGVQALLNFADKVDGVSKEFLHKTDRHACKTKYQTKYRIS